jgi:hypothetical protein
MHDGLQSRLGELSRMAKDPNVKVSLGQSPG